MYATTDKLMTPDNALPLISVTGVLAASVGLLMGAVDISQALAVVAGAAAMVVAAFAAEGSAS